MAELDLSTVQSEQRYQIYKINPRTMNSGESYDYWYGSGLAPKVTLFQGTPIERIIEGRGRHEVQNLSVERLKAEPFNDYLRHVIMFTRVITDSASAPHMETLIERLDTDIPGFLREAYGQTKGDSEIENEAEYVKARLFKATYSALLDGVRDPDARANPELVSRLYDLSKTYPDLFGISLILDDRNKENGSSLNLNQKIREDLVRDLAVQNPVGDLEQRLFWIKVSRPDILLSSMTQALLTAETQEDIERVMQRIASQTGLEKIRESLRGYVKDNPSFQATFDKIFNYLGLDRGHKPGSDLRNDVYEKIDFSEYKPNEENQPFEEALLKRELQGKGKILDLACGTGRLLNPLEKEGFQVLGIDFVPKHIEYIKEKHLQADVQVASWFSLPFSDGCFEGVYSLGRSFTHNVTIPDAYKCLLEIRRVLAEEGEVVIDLPDPESGEYKDLIDKTKAVTRKKGLKYVLPGLINDSPDGEHFFDRLALSPQQFSALAQLAGFSSEIVDIKPYKSASQVENTNIYYRLKKGTPGEDYTYYAKALLLNQIYGDSHESEGAEMLQEDPTKVLF